MKLARLPRPRVTSTRAATGMRHAMDPAEQASRRWRGGRSTRFVEAMEKGEATHLNFDFDPQDRPAPVPYCAQIKLCDSSLSHFIT